MGETKQNDPEALRQSGSDLSDIGGRMESTWQGLKDESDGMGDPFGDDMVGGLIGAAYQAVMQVADESFVTGAMDFLGFGDGLNTAGEVHSANEDAGVQDAELTGQQVEGLTEV